MTDLPYNLITNAGAKPIYAWTHGVALEAEASRLVSLGATRLHTNVQEGLDHYAVALTDPEGTEFDIN